MKKEEILELVILLKDLIANEITELELDIVTDFKNLEYRAYIIIGEYDFLNFQLDSDDGRVQLYHNGGKNYDEEINPETIEEVLVILKDNISENYEVPDDFMEEIIGSLELNTSYEKKVINECLIV